MIGHGKEMSWYMQQLGPADVRCADMGAIGELRLQIPNFDKLAIISFMAAVMSLGYSTIAIGISIHNGRSNNPAISVRPLLVSRP